MQSETLFAGIGCNYKKEEQALYQLRGEDLSTFALFIRAKFTTPGLSHFCDSFIENRVEFATNRRFHLTPTSDSFAIPWEPAVFSAIWHSPGTFVLSWHMLCAPYNSQELKMPDGDYFWCIDPGSVHLRFGQ